MTSLKNPPHNRRNETCWNCGQSIERGPNTPENAATQSPITPLAPDNPAEEWITFVSGAHRDHIPQTGVRLPVKSLRNKKWEQQIPWYEAVKPLTAEQAIALSGIGWEGDLHAMRSGQSPSPRLNPTVRQPMSIAEALAMEGIGWEGDLTAIRSGSNHPPA